MRQHIDRCITAQRLGPTSMTTSKVTFAAICYNISEVLDTFSCASYISTARTNAGPTFCETFHYLEAWTISNGELHNHCVFWLLTLCSLVFPHTPYRLCTHTHTLTVVEFRRSLLQACSQSDDSTMLPSWLFCAPMVDVAATMVNTTNIAATAVWLMQLLHHCQYTATTSATYCHHHSCSLPPPNKLNSLSHNDRIWEKGPLEQIKTSKKQVTTTTTTTTKRKNNKQAHYII